MNNQLILAKQQNEVVRKEVSSVLHLVKSLANDFENVLSFEGLLGAENEEAVRLHGKLATLENYMQHFLEDRG